MILRQISAGRDAQGRDLALVEALSIIPWRRLKMPCPLAMAGRRRNRRLEDR
jgi:hypothetical protein